MAFRRLPLQEITLTRITDHQALLDLFAQEEVVGTDVVAIINQLGSDLERTISYDINRENIAISTTSYLGNLFAVALKFSRRNTKIMLDAQEFFRFRLLCDVEWSRCLSQDCLATVRQLCRIYDANNRVFGGIYHSRDVILEDIFSHARQNPDGAVLAYLKFIFKNSAGYYRRLRINYYEQVVNSSVVLAQIATESSSYLHVLPRDIRQYVIASYLIQAHLYIN